MNHAVRRRFVWVPILALAALASSACTSEDTASSTTTSLKNVIVDHTTTSSSEAGAELCSAPSYTVEYPEGWSTNSEADGEPCQWFHPEPFEVPENSEAVGIAIRLRYDDVDYDYVSDPSNNSEEVLAFARSEIDGLPATRMRTKSEGEGLLDSGVESITWYVNAAGVTFTGATHGVVEGGTETNGPVLDDMIRSIRFRPADGES